MSRRRGAASPYRELKRWAGCPRSLKTRAGRPCPSCEEVKKYLPLLLPLDSGLFPLPSIRHLLGGFFFFLIGVAVEAVGEDEESGCPEADENAEEFTVGAEFEGGGASAL